MKTILNKCWFLVLLFVVSFDLKKQSDPNAAIVNNHYHNDDPLPSWNDGELKRSIIDFVTKITKDGTADFIPAEDRIATFDNDGTLWAEQPVIQELFMFYRARKMIKKNHRLKMYNPLKQ